MRTSALLGIALRRPEAWLGSTNVALTDVEASGTYSFRIWKEHANVNGSNTLVLTV